MVEFEYKARYGVDDFRNLIEILRGENGCPWDQEQTHESIRRNLLEEAYEVCEAIDDADADHMKEELGDLLMQILFHASIEEEKGGFSLDDVADAAVKKLIFRHPHVFGDAEASSAEEVLDNWDDIKSRERSEETASDSMRSVAKSLPSLWRAEKVQDKARKAGFDWTEIGGALDKLSEEAEELREAISTAEQISDEPGTAISIGEQTLDEPGTAVSAGEQTLDGPGTALPAGERIFEELGDLIFSAVNVARFAGVDPEDAVHAACDKFVRRFAFMEDEAVRQGLDFQSLTLTDLEELYQIGKQKEYPRNL